MKKMVFAAPHIKRFSTDEFSQSDKPIFTAISITGNSCELMCNHCKAKLLHSLYQVKSPAGFIKMCQSLYQKGCEGILITGGTNKYGILMIEKYADAIKGVRENFGFKLALHTKLANEEFARIAKNANVDVVMVDIVGSEKTLRNVYNLKNKSLSDIEASMEILNKYDLKIAPHIIIGLDYGNLEGEYFALNILKKYNFDTLVLVVLLPLINTPMENVGYPAIEGVKQVMKRAREYFPNKPISLGCVKGSGEYQKELEKYAIDLGFNSIAYPSEGIIDYARKSGYETQLSEYCCSF